MASSRPVLGMVLQDADHISLSPYLDPTSQAGTSLSTSITASVQEPSCPHASRVFGHII